MNNKLRGAFLAGVGGTILVLAILFALSLSIPVIYGDTSFYTVQSSYITAK